MWSRNPRPAILTGAVLALPLLIAALPVRADYTAKYNIDGLTAEALFKTVTNGGVDYLQVDLTSMTAVRNPGMVLTAVYFSLDNQAAALTGYSVQVLPGSEILSLNSGFNHNGDLTGPVDVSGEFAYLYDRDRIRGDTGANGIGSTGLEVFPNRYDWGGSSTNANLYGNRNIGGADFGLVGSIDPAANKGVRKDPLIESTARFLFSGLPVGFAADEQHIPFVQFNFGTSFRPVPEPMYVQLGVLLGLAGVGSGLRASKLRRGRLNL